MGTPLRRWAGVDVGARKGFDAAVIDENGLVAGPLRLTELPQLVRWLRDQQPRVVAVDSPQSPAASGELSRREERDLVRAGVCGIRYTPNKAALAANETYYAWIANGFGLYAALSATRQATGWEVIECFPTATARSCGSLTATYPRTCAPSTALAGSTRSPASRSPRQAATRGPTRSPPP